MEENKIVNLTEEDLEGVSGGVAKKTSGKDSKQLIPFACNKNTKKCTTIFYIEAGKKDVVCPKCGARYHIDG